MARSGRLQARYPQHPVVPILRATQLELQNLPLSENKAATAQFVQTVEQGLQLAKRMLDKNEDDPEAVFFMLTCHSYMASLYNNQGESLKAVGESKKAYNYLRDGFGLMDKNPDFYFTTGLYNYYIERYPMDHPIVRPFMIFFADGDIALGLKQMDVAATKRVIHASGSQLLPVPYSAQARDESCPGRCTMLNTWPINIRKIHCLP